MKKNIGFNFMAFSKGTVSTEGNVVKRYVGVAPVFVLAVNPDKAELEKLYNTQLENDPEYLGEVEVGEETSTRYRMSDLTSLLRLMLKSVGVLNLLLR